MAFVGYITSGGVKVCGAWGKRSSCWPSLPRRSQLTRECGGLPSIRLGRSPGRKWILCILNVTEHLWWMDIENCKAFKWPYTDQNFFNLPWNAAPPPLESGARGICPLCPRLPLPLYITCCFCICCCNRGGDSDFAFFISHFIHRRRLLTAIVWIQV